MLKDAEAMATVAVRDMARADAAAGLLERP